MTAQDPFRGARYSPDLFRLAIRELRQEGPRSEQAAAYLDRVAPQLADANRPSRTRRNPPRGSARKRYFFLVETGGRVSSRSLRSSSASSRSAAMIAVIKGVVRRGEEVVSITVAEDPAKGLRRT